MLFKSLKLGKSKDKDKEKGKAAKTSNIALLEEQLNNRTDDLKQTEKKLKKISGKVADLADLDAPPVRPHGPIQELSLEPVENPDGASSEQEGAAAVLEDKDAEPVKLVEAKPETINGPEAKLTPASAPAPTAEKAGKSDSFGDSLKDLFVTQEDEENPLLNLINSLPDVTIEELEEDLKEIKNIIKDWQKK